MSGSVKTSSSAARYGTGSSRRPTPCVGICSTTYGDLVCRGCKRYAHEIVQWNAYSQQQRNAVSQRLTDLRDSATLELVSHGRRAALVDECSARGMPPEQLEQASTATLVYELLCRSLSHSESLANAEIKLLVGTTPLETVQAIDRAFLQRSTAHYERAFKTPLV